MSASDGDHEYPPGTCALCGAKPIDDDGAPRRLIELRSENGREFFLACEACIRRVFGQVFYS